MDVFLYSVLRKEKFLLALFLNIANNVLFELEITRRNLVKHVNPMKKGVTRLSQKLNSFVQNTIVKPVSKKRGNRFASFIPHIHSATDNVFLQSLLTLSIMLI